MYYRAIRNDIGKSRIISLTIMLFIAAAALLVALAAILTINLSGAIDTLMTRSKTPHFMQMHSGPLNRDRLETFAENHRAVAEFQVAEFLNMEGALIVFKGGSLAGSVQDNGFSIQGEKFDYMVDPDGKPIRVSPGEIFVPITYVQQGLTGVGEKMRVSQKEYTVAGSLRDSQMNSLLSSSKRFLVNQRDYTEMKDQGTVEYLIEFRLHDLATLRLFEADYISAGLEANGPTLTYPLFRMINGLSDGLMIAVILLNSFLVVAVSFLCIRFTLLTKIEEDYREIGVMKAIGLRVSDIKKIYLGKYAFITFLGCLLGLGLSFIFQDTLLANIRLYMGESENAALAPILAVFGVLLVFLVILAFVNAVLGRFKRISPAQAVRFGISQDKTASKNRFSLRLNGLLNLNVLLGIKDVMSRKKIYATMLSVLILASFIIIVPRNLYNTISSETFITYMGAGRCDLRIDLQQTDHILEKSEEIAAAMENDPAITRFVVLTTKNFRVKGEDGSQPRLKVELGDHSVFPLTYSQGRRPTGENEIALSVMNAKEMGKSVGDKLILIVKNQEKVFTVCGIYSDLTNGGKTAKGFFTDTSADTMWSVISADLSDESLRDLKIAELTKRFAYGKVSDIDEFINQTYGSTISSMGKASQIALAIALFITLLITLLFMRMLVAGDRYSIGVMKSLGFTNRDIKMQYATRSIFILIAGIFLGTLLANTLGEALTGILISSFGASSFRFVINPLDAYVIPPLLMGLLVLVATIIGSLDAGKIIISENIKE